MLVIFPSSNYLALNFFVTAQICKFVYSETVFVLLVYLTLMALKTAQNIKMLFANQFWMLSQHKSNVFSLHLTFDFFYSKLDTQFLLSYLTIIREKVTFYILLFGCWDVNVPELWPPSTLKQNPKWRYTNSRNLSSVQISHRFFPSAHMSFSRQHSVPIVGTCRGSRVG